MSLRDELARALYEASPGCEWAGLNDAARAVMYRLADAIMPLIEAHAAAREAAKDAEIERLRTSIEFCSGSCGPVFPIDAAIRRGGGEG